MRRFSFLLMVVALVGCAEDSDSGSVDDDVDARVDEMEEGRQDAGREITDVGPAPDMAVDCLPEDEVCDEVDNDCDGRVDEGFAVGSGCADGMGPCRVEGTVVCVDGEAVCDAVAGESSDELCNEVDDDCDGTVDEDFPVGMACMRREGMCETSGVRVCTEDGMGTDCSAAIIEVGEELCDQRDNDCDGTVDEGIETGTQCEVGQGLCRRGGFTRCAEDGSVECDAQPGMPRDEACNGVDDDCDGVPDEDFGGEVCTVGEGACAREGFRVCVEGGELTCNVEPGEPGIETCNGLDDDCDGETDEEWPGVGEPCFAGLGACRGESVLVCNMLGNGTVCDAEVVGEPSPEVCNGIDDDCDGEVDDGIEGVGEPCEDPSLLECERGVTGCSDEGEIVCTGVAVDPRAESCNQADDDCDGEVDEDFPNIGEACEGGVGVCAGEGTLQCPPGGNGPQLVEGVQRDVDIAELERQGFRQCFRGLYSGRENIAGILDDCQGEVMLLGCREVGQAPLKVAAMGLREEVLTDTGREQQGINEHNGVAWYFSDQYSWGFAPAGAPVMRNSCDTAGQGEETRICWHTGGGALSVGWRCGANTAANANTERFVFVADNLGGEPVCVAEGAEPTPEACNGLDDDCDGETDEEVAAVGQPCELEDLLDCQRAIQRCTEEGELVCEPQAIDPQPEACNGFDDDCDGETDEDYPNLGQPCVNGEGICAREGTTICDPDGGNGGLLFEGIRQGVPVAELEGAGFEECWTGLYGENQPAVAQVLRQCDQDVLLLGCAPVGAAELTLAAVGERAEVIFDTGNGNVVNEHNGVGWYFNDSHSWGFAGLGDPVSRNSCDTNNVNPELRMCWHTGGGNMNSGYRCGNTFLNGNNGWRRVIYQRAGLAGAICDEPPGEPAEAEECNALDDDCDGVTDEEIPEVGQVCAEGLELCQRGEVQCAEGELICQGIDLEPSEEICNGIDDDCDGEIDNVEGLGEACIGGLGICEGEGVLQCPPLNAGPRLQEGVLNDVDIADLERQGFEQCFRGLYNEQQPVAGILEECQGEVMLLGCREVGQENLRVAAMGLRDEVLTDTGREAAGVHEHNGVAWYFSDQYSWGFAPEGAEVNRNSCDVAGDANDNEQRMCWHTGNGSLNFGWRCGDNRGAGANTERFVFVADGVGGDPICVAEGAAPEDEACNGLDDDCDGDIDEGFGLGDACEVGRGACRRAGVEVCDDNGDPTCSVQPGEPAEDVCNGVDDDCDGSIDEMLDCPFFAHCKAAFDAGNEESGLFPILERGGGVNQMWCDMVTDGGGWTLVASTAGQTLDDYGVAYYDDLQTLAPAGPNPAIYNGLDLGALADVRFTCRQARRDADAAFDVDLSFYAVPWYAEFAAAANDAESCFSEGNGNGDLEPPPARRDNIGDRFLPVGDQWGAQYLEGEDACGDTNDFTVDFDDRGMDSNQADGTDWGEDDSTRKCGNQQGLADGQWFIFVRPLAEE